MQPRAANGEDKSSGQESHPLALARCAVDVVSGLRCAKGDPIAGVVGVKLPDPPGGTTRASP